MVFSTTEIFLLAVSSFSFLTFVAAYSSSQSPALIQLLLASYLLLTLDFSPSSHHSLHLKQLSAFCLETLLGLLAFILSSVYSLNLLSSKDACRSLQRKIPCHLFCLNSSVQDKGCPGLFHSANNCIHKQHWSLSFLSSAAFLRVSRKKSLISRHHEQQLPCSQRLLDRAVQMKPQLLPGGNTVTTPVACANFYRISGR